MAAYTFHMDFTSLPAQNQEAGKPNQSRSGAVTLAIVLSLLACLLCGCTAPSRQARVEGQPTTVAPAPAETTPWRSPTPTAGPGRGVTPTNARREPAPASTAPASPPPHPAPTPSPESFCRPVPLRAGRPSYRFEVVAEPSAHRLHVRQQLTLADPLRLARGELAFNVPASHEPGVFALQGAWLAGWHEPLTVRMDGTALVVSLPATARQATAATVCLEYVLNLPPARSAGLSAVHALAWSELGDVAGYWYPVLAPYDLALGWRLIPYHFIGDPILFEAADYEVVVGVPEGYRVIAPAARTGVAGTWTFALHAARGVAFVVSNQLVSAEGVTGGIPVRVFHQPGHEEAGLAVLRAADEALTLFTQAFGPYPYDELAIVEATQFGGGEYSALITLSSQWFADYQEPAADDLFGRHPLVRFAVHEIAHQWWYGGVGTDQAHEPWLDEALARLGEWLYYSTLHPGHLSWWEAPSAQMDTVPINQPIYNFQDTASYVQAVYVSGTRFLLAAQGRLGPERFTAFLQAFYAQHQGQLVSQAEFLAALRAVMGPELDNLLPLYFAPLP